MKSDSLKRTPLYKNHLALGARMVPFAGYEMPVQYSGILEETKATRSAGGLFDVSHMGQFRVLGRQSLEDLSHLVTNDLSKLKLGQAQYNMLCREDGGVIDDLVIYRRSENETYICVNASNRQADFDWISNHLKKTSILKDESEETALIALQGPIAEKLLASLCDTALVTGLKYYWAAEATLFREIPCYLSRTGYTGEDGFELYLPASHASKLWDRLLEAGEPLGLKPIGLGARDTLRMEMGYPLHGHELSLEINPLEANLGWVVKLQKPVPFTGQSALTRVMESGGPSKILKGLLIEGKRIGRQGYDICTAGREKVGIITSGTMSPTLNAPIALGFVDRKQASAEKLYIDIRGELVPARLAPLPFVPSHTKKQNV